MASNWYFRSMGSEFGPVSFQELAEIIATESLSLTDLVRREGDAEWMRAEDVAGLTHRSQQVQQDHFEPESTASLPQATVKEQPRGDNKRRGNSAQRVTADRPAATWRQLVAWLCSLAASLILTITVWQVSTAHSRLYPRPEDLPGPSTFRVLGWGPLTELEFCLVLADIAVITAFLSNLAVRRLGILNNGSR